MQNHGILQEIRDLLALGNTSRKVIDMGYAPGSVYKAQRQVRDGRVQGVQSPSQLTRREGTPGEPLFLRGRLTVFPDDETVAIWHFDPPLPCPGCGGSVEHWWVCLNCDKLLPEDCHCPTDSASQHGGFTLKELLGRLAD